MRLYQILANLHLWHYPPPLPSGARGKKIITTKTSGTVERQVQNKGIQPECSLWTLENTTNPSR